MATSTPEPRKVNTRHPDVDRDEERHELNRALRMGVREMRRLALRYRYMRPNPGELEPVELNDLRSTVNVTGDTVKTSPAIATVYELRVMRSSMPNPWADTIENTARLPFRSRIILDGWDDTLAGEYRRDDTGRLQKVAPGWVDDIDGEGTTLDGWAGDAFADALFEGIVYAFVDNDRRSFPDAASRQRAGARPYVTTLKRGDLQWYIVDNTGSRPRLAAVCWAEQLRQQDITDPNAWIDEAERAYKVVVAGDLDAPRGAPEAKVRVRVYREDENGEVYEDPELAGVITPDRPEDELRDIPLVPLYGERCGPWRGESPYLKSSDMQVTLWNAASEWINKVRETSLSIVHETGVEPGKPAGDAQPVHADSRNARYRWSTKENAKLSIVESSGEALEAIGAALDRMVSWIENAHHQINSERPTAPVTAREITLEGVHASSALEQWVIMHEAAWGRVLHFMALLGGLGLRDGTASIPHDFGLPSAGMDRNKELYSTGKMTALNYWREAQRAGDVDERGFDVREEVRRERLERVEQVERLVHIGVPPWDAIRAAGLDEPVRLGDEELEASFALRRWDHGDVPLVDGRLVSLEDVVVGAEDEESPEGGMDNGAGEVPAAFLEQQQVVRDAAAAASDDEGADAAVE